MGILKDLGLEVHEGTGVIGILRARQGNRAIALRADMHACRHDGHMAVLLGAAQKLAANPEFEGTVVFIFQPNEELDLGAKAMINNGVLKQWMGR